MSSTFPLANDFALSLYEALCASQQAALQANTTVSRIAARVLAAQVDALQSVRAHHPADTLPAEIEAPLVMDWTDLLSAALDGALIIGQRANAACDLITAGTDEQNAAQLRAYQQRWSSAVLELSNALRAA